MSFDTVLNMQVLEHVVRPIAMVSEIARILRPGGHAIFLIPQTSYLHLTPHHYGNFTRYWIQEVMPEHGLEIIELRPLGGLWSSMFSHSIYFFLHSLRIRAFRTSDKRPLLFFVLFPFMTVFALISMPFYLLFSVGDLTEDANNHLVVVRK